MKHPLRPTARRAVPVVAATALALLVAGCSGSASTGSGPAASSGSASSSASSGTARADGGSGVAVVPLADRSTAPGRASWAPWPSALHDARHSGSSTAAGPSKGEEVWRRHLDGGALPAGPVVGKGGLAYLVDAAGTLHAIDLENGDDAWTAKTGQGVSGDLSVSPLVLPDGDVVAGDAEGLGAWGPKGEKRWSVALDGSPTSPVTTDGKRLYVGTGSGQVAAVDVAAGGASARRAWSTDVGSTSYSSVVTDGSGRVLTTNGKGLVAIDDHGQDAVVAWKAEPDDGLVEVSPGLSADGVSLLGTNGQHEWAYGRDGKLLWKAPRRITYSSPSVTEDGLAYLGEHVNRVHVFDAASGKQVGLYPTTVGKASGRTRVWTSVVVDSGHDAYFATRTHWLIGVRPDGERKFTLDLGASTSSYPALTGDGGLLIGTDDGDLVMVR